MAVDFTTYQSLQQELKSFDATLVAVSKTKSAADIQQLYNAGQRDFGENYVQELIDKEIALPKDIRWHFIGHLQRNKVKQIIPIVHLIHGVDSLRLLSEINKQASIANRTVSVLLQLHIATEETKFGMDNEEFTETLLAVQKKEFLNVAIQGLMGMASFTSNMQLITEEFQHLHGYFLSMRKELPTADILSMGMSADYKIALNCGSTLIRIGSALFGDRIKS